MCWEASMVDGSWRGSFAELSVAITISWRLAILVSPAVWGSAALLYILFGAGDKVLLFVAWVSHMTWEPQKKTATGPRSGVTPLADPSREPTDHVGNTPCCDTYNDMLSNDLYLHGRVREASPRKCLGSWESDKRYTCRTHRTTRPQEPVTLPHVA